MEASFRSRLDQVFGGLGTNASSLWSVSSAQLERRQWRPETSDNEEESPPCSSSFRSEEQAHKKARMDENGGEEDDENEDEMIQVGGMIGMDSTLDFEDEEDEYDKVAVGREGAGERLYTSDVKASFDSLSVLPSPSSRTGRDERASHTGAASRLAEDAKEARQNGSADLYKKMCGIKSPDKRKNEHRNARPEKKVRFSVEENTAERPRDRDTSSQRPGAGFDRYRNVPDHVRHPEKYTHYTLDWSEEGNSNVQAWQATMAAVSGSKNKNEPQSEEKLELPQHVAFVPRGSKEKSGSKHGGGSKETLLSSVGLAARAGEEEDDMVVEENSQSRSKSQRNRSYRSRSTTDQQE